MVGLGGGSDSEARVARDGRDPDPVARFEALYAAHLPELVRFVGHRLPTEVVGDAVAEVFVVAWRRLDEVNPDNPRAWLFAIAQRIIANEVRARNRRGRLARKAERLRVDDEPAAPEDVVSSNDDRRLVLAALDRLPAADRDLLIAITWDGLSVGDAAVLYGCSPGTLSVRLHRARGRLAEEFRKAEAGRATPVVRARFANPAPDGVPEPGPEGRRGRIVRE